MSSETTLVEAIDAIRAGDQETARTLLLELTQSAPQRAEGWLWLAAVTPNPAGKLAFFDGICNLPTRASGAEPEQEKFNASVVSFQHPDHDTAQWPPRGGN